MGSPLRLKLVCAAGILLGLLLFPFAPEIGAGVIFLVCGLVMVVWACRS